MISLWHVLQSVFFLGALLHGVTTWVQAIRRGRKARLLPATEIPLPDTLPSVSILIPAWREANTLEPTIAALAAVTYPACQEWIFIAGGPDKTYARVRQLTEQYLAGQNVQVLEQQPNGKNAALTQGLAVASGEVIIVLDADTRVRTDWLTQLVRPLCAGAAAACGNYFPLHQTRVSCQEQMEKISRYEIHQQPILQGSGSIAIWRDVLEAIGGFPADVRVGVDWELDARISSHGLTKAFAGGAHVHTQRPATLAEYWKNEIRWRRAHLSHLWRQRDWFLRSVRDAFQNTSPYLVALFPFFCALGIAVGIVAGSEDALSFWLIVSSIYLIWIFVHRAALVTEVSVYTGDIRWLALFWVPGTLLLVSIVASWQAMATLTRQNAHFKGPRS